MAWERHEAYKNQASLASRPRSQGSLCSPYEGADGQAQERARNNSLRTPPLCAGPHADQKNPNEFFLKELLHAHSLAC